MPAGRRLALLDAPLRSSLLTLGTEAAAGLLREFAVTRAPLDRIEAADRGEVALPPPGSDDYLAGGPVPKNESRVRESLRAIAAAVAPITREGSTPILFGGDATVLLGFLAGLSDGDATPARRGLVSFDGLGRFRTPAELPGGDLSRMAIALATGRGPPSITHLARDRFPLVQESDVVLVGVRDAAPDEAVALVQSRVALLPPEQLPGAGGAAAFMGTLGRLLRTTHDVMLHIDASVLDPTQFPVAVGEPAAGGLSSETCKRLLGELTRWNSEGTIHLAGLAITGVDARKDPGGVRMHELARLALRVFGES